MLLIKLTIFLLFLFEAVFSLGSAAVNNMVGNFSVASVKNPRLGCLNACNQNSNCKVIMFVPSQNMCMLFKNYAIHCLAKSVSIYSIVYDKYASNPSSSLCGGILYILPPQIGTWFYVSIISLDWASAKDFCANISMTLLVVDSDSKFTFSNALATTTDFWVNSRAIEIGQFYWPDGSPVQYWGSFQPDNTGGNSTYLAEGCASITVARINDANCAGTMRFICQDV